MARDSRKQDDVVILDWRDVNHDSGRWSARWRYRRALYAILHPDKDEVLYLGKADGSTVRARWDAADKHDRVWSRIEDERELYEHGFIVAEVRLPPNRRLTRELITDIESLLILEIDPWANCQNTKSRGSVRQGMMVKCTGHWPLQRKTFRDEG